MKAFYVFGVTDLQDMLPSMITFSKKEKIWISIFDCLRRKNQFSNYSKKEVLDFVKGVIEKNGNGKNASIDFHTIEKDYNHKYKIFNPDLILMQGIYHKFPKWIPNIGRSKVIHYAWGPDGASNVSKSPYKKNIVLNIARYEKDLKVFEKLKLSAVYYGNLIYESFAYEAVGYDALMKTLENRKVAFIPETWNGGHGRNGANTNWSNSEVEQYFDKKIKLLKDEKYYVIVKKREKGMSENSDFGFLSRLKELPDLIVSKDLYFPSFLYYAPKISEKILITGKKTEGTEGTINIYKKLGIEDNDLIFNEKRDFDIKKISSNISNCKKISFKSRQIVEDKPSIKIYNYCVKYLKHEYNNNKLKDIK